MNKNIAPMGWNSWDCYGASVTEETVRANARFMAEKLKVYGWEYVVVDIQWYEPKADSHEYHPFTELCMDEYGRLMPAENRFPSSAGGQGFKPLADYIHSLGLKFGIHIMRGIPRMAVHKDLPVYGSDLTARQIAKTDSICAWNTDMYGVDTEKGGKAYYESLFKLYAEWGVDFIKIDDICRELPHCEAELIAVSEALKGCGREMVLSLSPGPALLEKAELYKQVSNMWRITDDFWDKWEQLYDMFERAEKWCIHAGAGHFPDADMLPIGPILQDYDKDNRTKFDRYELKTMMTLWSIFRAPLMIGGEMTGFDDFTMSLVTNSLLLQMHADVRHSHPVWKKKINGREHIVWMGTGAAGGYYVCVFNTSETEGEIFLPMSDLELADSNLTYTECWTGETGRCGDGINVRLHRHSAKAYYLQQG
jgi:hypothetical protein